MTKNLCFRVALLLILLVPGACQNVQPWERGILARPEMQLDPDKLASRLRDQVYFSKEASSGGNNTAGAGCGCN